MGMHNNYLKKTDTILIIGKSPPPIGGVTIHVSRLCQHLKRVGHGFKYYDLKNGATVKLAKLILMTNNAHLHSSNTILKLIFVIFCKIAQTKSIITLHADLNRFGSVKVAIEKVIIIIATVPLVLNHDTYIQASRLNKNAKMVTAFFPPLQVLALDSKIKVDLENILKQKKILCTNAFDVTFDNYGKEIYGLSELLIACEVQSEYVLVISDPSGNYQRFIRRKSPALLHNAYWISTPHSFYEVLKLSTAFVRNTTTDGDSLSVREALFLGKLTFATDVVCRPDGIVLYKSVKEIFQNKGIQPEQLPSYSLELVVDEYTKIYG